MARSVRIAVTAALLLTGTSLATAKIRGVVGGHANFHPPDIPGYTYSHVKPGGWQ